MGWARVLAFLLLLSCAAHGQGSPAFVTGAPLCANTTDPPCLNAGTPQNPLGLNQAFSQKQNYPITAAAFGPIFTTANTWTAMQAFSAGLTGALTGSLSGSVTGSLTGTVNGVNMTGTPSIGYALTGTSSTAATWQNAVSNGITHNTIGTTNISPVVLSFITAGYAAVGDVGSGCVYVRGTITGPGAVPSADGAYWQLSLNNDSLSITCFGAKMDGATTDDAAVNAAIAAVGSGGVIYVPEGRTVWNAVNVTASNIQIKCSSLNATNIVAATGTSNVLTATNVGNFIVRDCGFWSNLAFTTGAQQTAGAFLTLNSCGSCYIEHFEFNFGFNSAIITGSNAVFDYFDGGVSNGAANFHYLVSGGSDHHFNHIATGQGPAPAQAVAGIAIVQSGGTWIENSDLLKSGNSIYIVPTSGQSVLWSFFDNTALGDTCSGSGMLIQPSAGGLVYGGAVSNSWAATCNFGVSMIATGAGSVIGGWQFSNMRIFNNMADGLFIEQTAGGVVNNITFQGHVFGNSQGSSGTFSGIHLTGAVSHLNLRGMSGAGAQINLPNAQKFNILIDAAASDYIDYSDMDLCGFVTAAVSDSSTGQHNRASNNMCWNPIGVTGPTNVPASPATICAGSSPETHYYLQSATNTATIKLGSGAGPTVGTLTSATIPVVTNLGPNECEVVTWTTTAPTYSKSVH